MKRRTLIVALALAAIAAIPASADTTTGNWLSYLKVDGCNCDIGSFRSTTTKYTVDANGPQGTVGTSKQTIQIEAGNQTQNIQVAIIANGQPVAVSSNGSGQQNGVYYTSSQITLNPGSNTVAVTASDPNGVLKPTTTTLTIPYHPPTLASASAPVVIGKIAVGQVLACNPGTWTSDPTNVQVTTSWDTSTDGKTWVSAQSGTVTAGKTATQLRCETTASNGYMTASAYSDPVTVPAGMEAPTTTSQSSTTSGAPTTPVVPVAPPVTTPPTSTPPTSTPPTTTPPTSTDPTAPTAPPTTTDPTTPTTPTLTNSTPVLTAASMKRAAMVYLHVDKLPLSLLRVYRYDTIR